MSEAGRSDAAHAHDAATDADRDAKIEQLLLAGLDHYFAARYDQAIHVWTRALFLDRSHPRARAYIERARSALAERQRQSEELLHSGVDAFRRGESDEARRLLRAAIDGGAPADEALALLDRLDQLEGGASAPSPAASRTMSPVSPSGTATSRARPGTAFATLAVLVGGVLAFGGYAAIARRSLSWRALLMLDDPPAQSVATPVIREQTLPPPRRGELAVTRARALAAGGHLADALAALEQVRPTDPQKLEADQLRAELQRELLAVTTGVSHVP